MHYCFDHVGKKHLLKLDKCCAGIVQPHVVYCSVGKVVDGMHFVRD